MDLGLTLVEKITREKRFSVPSAANPELRLLRSGSILTLSPRPPRDPRPCLNLVVSSVRGYHATDVAGRHQHRCGITPVRRQRLKLDQHKPTRNIARRSQP